jgi:hypothetical protein
MDRHESTQFKTLNVARPCGNTGTNPYDTKAIYNNREQALAMKHEMKTGEPFLRVIVPGKMRDLRRLDRLMDEMCDLYHDQSFSNVVLKLL